MPWIEQLRSVSWGQASCICLASYLLGCFSTGYYLVRLRAGLDIRLLGSGSVGARNVGRICGWPSFGATLLGDFAKGAVVVWTVGHFIQDDHLLALSMLAVVAGHIWPVQLGFHGGKGVATSLGTLAAWDYHLAFGLALLFLGCYVLLRRTLLAGLLAFGLLPLLCTCVKQLGPPERSVTLSLLAGLVLVAHRRNLAEEILHFIERRHLTSNTDHTNT